MSDSLLNSCPIWGKPCIKDECTGYEVHTKQRFYNLSTQQNKENVSKLLEYVRNAANKIASLTYTEIRLEHTRHFTIFSDLEHKILSKMA